MKIMAILVLRTPGDASASASSPGGGGEEKQHQAAVLANASDVSRFRFFRRRAARKFTVSVARAVVRTVGLCTAPVSLCQTVQHEGYKVHCYNPNGLCAVVLTDDHYPDTSAHSILIKVLEEYRKDFGESWRTAKDHATKTWKYLDDALKKYQDPAEADKLANIQGYLDESQSILHKTIVSVLRQGESLDSLVAKSSELSAAAQMFYKPAKITNSYCTISGGATPLATWVMALSAGLVLTYILGKKC